MTKKERKNIIWRSIILKYIPDEETVVEIKEENSLIIMAVCEIDDYWGHKLSIYTGENYEELMFNSGYLDSLWEQNTYYLDEMFTPEEKEEIMRAWEED